MGVINPSARVRSRKADANSFKESSMMGKGDAATLRHRLRENLAKFREALSCASMRPRRRNSIPSFGRFRSSDQRHPFAPGYP